MSRPDDYNAMEAPILSALIGDAWAQIPDDMAGDYDALGDAITALVEQRDAAREARDNWEASATRLAAERDADLARFAEAPPTFTVAQQWRDARQLLNDAGYSELTLPAAVASLLPPPADEDELAASIARHPSSRRKPEQPADSILTRQCDCQPDPTATPGFWARIKGSLT